MIVFLLELLMIITAPLAHIILCLLNIKGRIKVSIIIITLICLIAGIVLPIFASYIDLINLPSDIKCATGVVGFAILGMLITVAVIPASAIIFSVIAYHKRKKINIAA